MEGRGFSEADLAGMPYKDLVTRIGHLQAREFINRANSKPIPKTNMADLYAPDPSTPRLTNRQRDAKLHSISYSPVALLKCVCAWICVCTYGIDIHECARVTLTVLVPDSLP